MAAALPASAFPLDPVCGDCGASVPLDALGEHLMACSPARATPLETVSTIASSGSAPSDWRADPSGCTQYLLSLISRSPSLRDCGLFLSSVGQLCSEATQQLLIHDAPSPEAMEEAMCALTVELQRQMVQELGMQALPVPLPEDRGGVEAAHCYIFATADWQAAPSLLVLLQGARGASWRPRAQA